MRTVRRRLGRALHRVPVRWRKGVGFYRGSKRVPGLPPGLSHDTLNEAAVIQIGDEIAEVWHEHLSNWKPTHTHRVTVKSKGGRYWTVIFKNADYGPEKVPAQRGLPVVLGRPEYRVLSSPASSSLDFVPTVYWTGRVDSQERFGYLMEDLDRAWYQPVSNGGLLAAVAALSQVHAGLQSSLAGDTAGLIRYDSDYSVALRRYVQTSVERYLDRHPDATIEEQWDAWPTLSSTHEQAAPPAEFGGRAIHGDFNVSNLYIHWRSRNRIKALDWEWAGFGHHHTDLASVLKAAPDSLVQKALHMYARAFPEVSPAQHERLYTWCALQNAIRDAGYVAAQFVESSHIPRLDPPRYIADSLRHANTAQRALNRMEGL